MPEPPVTISDGIPLEGDGRAEEGTLTEHPLCATGCCTYDASHNCQAR